MSRCPHCNKPKVEEKMLGNAIANAEVYGDSNVVMVSCCKGLIRVARVVSYRIDPIDSANYQHDDWGNEVTR